MSRHIVLSIFSFFLLTITFLTIVNSAPTLSSSNYVKAFKHFNTELLSAQTRFYKESGVSNLVKASGFSTFSIAHLLAILNQQSTWKIPGTTENIEKVLRLSTAQITDGYEYLYELVNQNDDPSTYMYSNIFTNENVTLDDENSISKLGTTITKVDPEIWESEGSVALVINSQIGLQTLGQIYDDGDLVPFPNWYGPGVEKSARAVFLNTQVYSGNWQPSAEIASIGRQHFGKDERTTEFIAYSGIVGVNENEKFLTVGIPLEDPKNAFAKTLVLAQPKMGLENVTTADLEQLIKSSPHMWSGLTRTVEFPVMNFSLYSNFHEQLSTMGVEDTFCELSSSDENVLKKISQKVRLTVNVKGVVAASATAVELDKNEDFNSTRPDALKLFHKEQKKVLQKQKSLILEDLTNEEVETSAIRIDQPFFWYLDDSTLGPMYFGSTLSFKKYEDYFSSEEFELLETLQSFTHWACQLQNPSIYPAEMKL